MPHMWIDFPDEENNSTAHHCFLNWEYGWNGHAVEECIEDKSGALWVIANCEYASRVRFCPVCGYETKKSFEEPSTAVSDIEPRP